MEEFDLLQCIDRGLEPFGSNIKQSIYWKMSILHNFSREEMIGNPQLLVDIIKETLGDSAVEVERSIIREIRTAFNLPREESAGLIEAIEGAKNQIIGVCQNQLAGT